MTSPNENYTERLVSDQKKSGIFRSQTADFSKSGHDRCKSLLTHDPVSFSGDSCPADQIRAMKIAEKTEPVLSDPVIVKIISLHFLVNLYEL